MKMEQSGDVLLSLLINVDNNTQITRVMRSDGEARLCVKGEAVIMEQTVQTNLSLGLKSLKCVPFQTGSSLTTFNFKQQGVLFRRSVVPRAPQIFVGMHYETASQTFPVKDVRGCLSNKMDMLTRECQQFIRNRCVLTLSVDMLSHLQESHLDIHI